MLVYSLNSILIEQVDLNKSSLNRRCDNDIDSQSSNEMSKLLAKAAHAWQQASSM